MKYLFSKIFAASSSDILLYLTEGPLWELWADFTFLERFCPLSSCSSSTEEISGRLNKFYLDDDLYYYVFVLAC